MPYYNQQPCHAHDLWIKLSYMKLNINYLRYTVMQHSDVCPHVTGGGSAAIGQGSTDSAILLAPINQPPD